MSMQSAHCKAIESICYTIMKGSTLSGYTEFSTFTKMVPQLLRRVDDQITSVDITFTEIGWGGDPLQYPI